MRLDRYDSYLARFHARVTDLNPSERGTWVRLDRSAFYPAAGGQPRDEGSIEASGQQHQVLDLKLDAQQVWHLLDATLRVGDEVQGQIDWPRRYRHMQRHTAQHLLSQALLRVNTHYGTLSVSMRGPDCTIDFGGQVDAAALAALEHEVNAAARRALPVMTFDVNDQQLADYRLRRPAKVSGVVRLVAIGDYDLVACGGTHLGNGAEALPIKVLKSEHVKGGVNRLTFRAGEEALQDYALKHGAASELGASLSVPADGVVARVAQLQQELAAAQGQLAEARRQQAAALAGGLTGSTVSLYLDAERAPLFDALVELLQARAATVSLLAAATADGARFAFLAGPGCAVDVRPALSAALQPLGGRGGGRPDRAQGAAAADAQQARLALQRATELLA
jgi:alanyl-tRNA synthetase